MAELRADLDADTRTRLDAILRMVGDAFPAAVFFNDYANNPRALEPETCDFTALVGLARIIATANDDIGQKDLKDLLHGIEPFAGWPKELDRITREALKNRS